MPNEYTEQVEVEFDSGVSTLVNKGATLLELSKQYQNNLKAPSVAAYVNNEIRELGYEIDRRCRIRFITLKDEEGMRIYRRSLCFILIKAVKELYPGWDVVISHSISKGLYCEITGDRELTEEDVAKIEARMREITEKKLPFVKRVLPIEEAREKLTKSGRHDWYNAIMYSEKEYVTLYECDGFEDYLYGYMTPDTGFIKCFALMYYKPGLILRYPEKDNPDSLPEFVEQKKLFSIFKEYKRWGAILGVENVGALNKLVKEGKSAELIRISEALHEKKIAQIADKITGYPDCAGYKKVVLIAGPSSSGKTTFAKRLAVQLIVNGFKPIIVGMDDYFVNRANTPLDENGKHDYEAVEAIDIKLFQQHLEELVSGFEVEVPIFDFVEGERKSEGRKIKLENNGILIIEGIHALNETLTQSVPASAKIKVYVSALTSLNIDNHNMISSTDTRQLRRIVRDNQFRGTSAVSTLERWPSVIAGEVKHIFPYQENADIMFNSFHMAELGVIKNYAAELLSEIDPSSPHYPEAKRLSKFLSYILPIDSREIPANSIIREFIGGSSFK